MPEKAYGSFSEYLQKDGAVTEDAVRGFLVGKAAEDAAFRKALTDDPLATVEAEVGIKMPAGLKLVVHEETNDELHLVLRAPNELTPAQLQTVSGGWPPTAVPGSTTNDDALWDNDGGNDYD